MNDQTGNGNSANDRPNVGSSAASNTDDSPQRTVVKEIWDAVLTNSILITGPSPTVSGLKDLGVPPVDCVFALETASAWIYENLTSDINETAVGIVDKWHHVVTDEGSRGMGSLPAWVLRNLVVDCWQDVWRYQHSGTSGGRTVGYGPENNWRQHSSTRHIWTTIFSSQPGPVAPFPKVSTLRDLDIPHSDLADALKTASSWIVGHLRGVRDLIAEDYMAEWSHVSDVDHAGEFPRVADLPKWVLENLLVNAWADVWSIVQMLREGLIDLTG